MPVALASHKIVDTIVGCATPLLPSAISVIRLSGNQAINIVNKLTQTKTRFQPNTFKLLKIKDNNLIIDDAVILFYLAPKSFTGENMCEINCHGNPIIVQKIIDLCISFGARLAMRGEFTKQAVINRKLTLTQASAINDLINNSEENFLQPIRIQLEQNTIPCYEEIEQLLQKNIIDLTANIDYADETTLDLQKLLERTKKIYTEVDSLIHNFNMYQKLQTGLNIIIIGAPNVGKSSLFNALLKTRRAIVSSIQGTTRDYLKESIWINQIKINLIDCAGIITTNDKLEMDAIQQIQSLEAQIDAVIFLQDITSELNFAQTNPKLDIQLQFFTKKEIPIVAFINKADLLKTPSSTTTNLISVKNNNLAPVYEFFQNIANQYKTTGSIVCTNKVQINQLIKIKNAVVKIMKATTKYRTYPEIYLLELQEILYYIRSLQGKEWNEEFIEELFQTFCVGK